MRTSWFPSVWTCLIRLLVLGISCLARAITSAASFSLTWSYGSSCQCWRCAPHFAARDDAHRSTVCGPLTWLGPGVRTSDPRWGDPSQPYCCYARMYVTVYVLYMPLYGWGTGMRSMGTILMYSCMDCIKQKGDAGSSSMNPIHVTAL